MSRRRIIVLGVVALVVAAGLLVVLMEAQQRMAPQSALRNDMQAAVAKPVDFVKSHVTGGVGASLMMDAAASVPRIVGVLPGSPAEKAGLRANDLIVAVNDQPTAGKPLAQVVETIRGFTMASVSVTVRRLLSTNATSSTNITFVIHRSSWNQLGVPAGNIVPTGTPVIPATGPVLVVPNGGPSGTNGP